MSQEQDPVPIAEIRRLAEGGGRRFCQSTNPYRLRWRGRTTRRGHQGAAPALGSILPNMWPPTSPCCQVPAYRSS